MRPAMPLPANILVPTDFSDEATTAGDYAATLAAALGARLHVLHVIPARPFGDDLEAGDMPELLERTEREVRDRLDAWRAAGDRRGVTVVTDVGVGVPDAAILRYADTHDIDLIVMGRSGHRGDPARLGRVAAGVLKNARRPVLAMTAASTGDGLDSRGRNAGAGSTDALPAGPPA